MRIVFFALVLAACSRSASSSDGAPAPSGLRYGGVMAEVGHRFELAGRAADSGRFELAEFEAGELGELFDEDLPRAELPKEGTPATLPALASEFAKNHPKALENAAHAKDRAAFADAFQRASVACNACHQASGHGFIEIPALLGKPVPSVDPK